jgi:hypothetical protein
LPSIEKWALHISGMMNAIYVKNSTYCRDVPMERLYDSSHGYAMPKNAVKIAKNKSFGCIPASLYLMCKGK